MMEHPKSVEIIPFEGPGALAGVTAKPPALFLRSRRPRNFLGVLYGQTRQEGLSQIDRHVLRLDKRKPMLEQIKASIQAARTDVCPRASGRPAITS
jgi:hypothetical protein